MSGCSLAMIALVPAMIGPLPQGDAELTALLCAGEKTIEITIPIPRDGPPDDAPCHSKGCHGPSCRKRFDASQ